MRSPAIAFLILFAVLSGGCSLLAFIFPFDRTTITVGWTAFFLCIGAVVLFVILDSRGRAPAPTPDEGRKSTLPPPEKDMWK